MHVELVQETPNPIEFIAKIASICYDSDPKDPMKLVKHLYKNGHHSVFEHVYFTFKIEGVSRALSHQLVRHRHCSFTQRSQRYCLEDAFEYVTPPSVSRSDLMQTVFDLAISTEQEGYNALVEMLTRYHASALLKKGMKEKEACSKARTMATEDARFVLPNACATSLFLSCNLRELVHIANERLCTRAQWEIRELVQQMVELVNPDLRWMLVPKCLSGWIICNSPCRKKD